MNKTSRPLWNDGMIVLRGICMGGADVVPGVSGGTIALILGIYERLITAISRVDLTLLGHLRRGQWRQAADHLDLRFLVTLGTGIGLGFVAVTLVINGLLTSGLTRALTLAVFFGMILASAVLVGLMVRVSSAVQTAGAVLLGLFGAGLAFWLTTLPGARLDPSLPYLFLCGSVAICAMILPGISGAMVLLILGVYLHLTELPRQLLRGEQVGEVLLTILVFAAGCAIGLVGFSKLLRWLLATYHWPTMAVLCGFMLGALHKLWPFQQDLTPHVEKFKHKQFQPVWPEALDGHVLAVLAAAALAMLVVLLAERFSRVPRRQLSGAEAASQG